MITHLSELAGMAKKKARKTIAVAAAHDREVLQAVVQAYRQGIADAILTGEEEKIRELLREEGVEIAVCNNALRKNGIAAEELTEGVRVVPAGVVELAERQFQGYAYIRP